MLDELESPDVGRVYCIKQAPEVFVEDVRIHEPVGQMHYTDLRVGQYDLVPVLPGRRYFLDVHASIVGQTFRNRHRLLTREQRVAPSLPFPLFRRVVAQEHHAHALNLACRVTRAISAYPAQVARFQAGSLNRIKLRQAGCVRCGPGLKRPHH